MRIGQSSKRLGLLVIGGSSLSALLIPAAAHAAPTTIVNGSFETPVQASSSGSTTYGTGSTAITGFTVVGGSVDLVDSTVWQANDGKQSVDLSGRSPGNLFQAVSTVPGQAYTLTYALGGNFYCGQKVKTINVFVDGAVADVQTFDTTNSTKARMGWVTHTLNFTATRTSTQFDFSDATPDFSACGAALDSVSLASVPPVALPEAPAVPMIGAAGLGAAGIGALVVRRRHARTS